MENFNQINSHKNSPLPEKVDLFLKEESFRIDKYQDKETGEIYFPRKDFENLKEVTQKEYFVALLIKGIFHSSDIVKIGKEEYFSRKIDLENVEPGKPFEKEAEIFILKSIIGDYDKGIDDGIPRNIQEEDGKFAHFDYEKSFLSESYKKIHENPENVSNIFYEFCNKNKFLKDDIYNFSIQVSDKLEALEQTVEDRKFILAILKKSNFNPLLEKISGEEKSEKEEEAQDDRKFIKVKELFLPSIYELKKVIQRELKEKDINTT